MVPPKKLAGLRPVVWLLPDLGSPECFVLSFRQLAVRQHPVELDANPCTLPFRLIGQLDKATSRQTTTVLTADEREIEPCFWSRAGNSERINKKTQAA